MKAGLIASINRVYSLTLFGKVIYNFQTKVGIAIEYYWKLKARFDFNAW